MQRLYKSDKDKVFDGVCGGIGEYLAIDPVIVRLLWILLIIFGGTGVIAYLVAMVIMPRRGADIEAGEKQAPQDDHAKVSQKFWGLLLMVAGGFLLLGLLGPITGIFAGLTLFMGHALWPILIIGVGLYLFMNQNDKPNVKSDINDMFSGGTRLQRSRTDRRLTGVCGGIAHYFGIDSTIIRIFWVMATLGSFGFGILAYLALSFFLTEAE